MSVGPEATTSSTKSMRGLDRARLLDELGSPDVGSFQIESSRASGRVPVWTTSPMAMRRWWQCGASSRRAR